ncbi:hypothetical protein BJ138DRAFT_50010 [Hygrophoropsis aurantiaca]|uniref:Uncharacterized protein n=1 Tax=Hygrophoropsis aurantiaca TaxID=72124 RepID=A0ACB7ZSX9_9AGAM|nr:hypothetical protein BJ138DRAFT_50010 [Hygrophoropsis aurantiaca]
MPWTLEASRESRTISLYNVLFTVLPPFVIGIFDQFVSARILDRYPRLYALGQKNVFFTKTAFWLWWATQCITFRPLWIFSHFVLGRPRTGAA